MRYLLVCFPGVTIHPSLIEQRPTVELLHVSGDQPGDQIDLALADDLVSPMKMAILANESDTAARTLSSQYACEFVPVGDDTALRSFLDI